MCGRKIALFLVFLLIFSLSNVGIKFVSCWSNGGYSDDPSNPCYGTHDWIAEHALDWLPDEEKQYTLDNLAAYLYGTELPDNGGAPDGIGDTVKHHVYYYANGSLQDDASAVRAQTEYYKAIDFFRGGYLVNASKILGIMSHYIVDVTVFGHVMGATTDWRAETHHSDYESYVQGRTSSYESEFNTYLVFDGNLTRISAYDATCLLAYDTTFDLDGDLTCVWMDQNYNWSNPIFKDRCGESLNLAVNLLADVLHTFYLGVHEHYIEVPFYYQVNGYYCGPVALQMVFDFYGENISQFEIADVARTVGDPSYVTYTDEMRRATHFSNLSTSMGSEMSENITGYTLRKFGYATFEQGGMTTENLKSLIDMGYPIILLMRWMPDKPYGHYRVTVGYNESYVFLHDPWNITWGGDYGGPNIAMNYTFFQYMWEYSGYWGLFVSPWRMDIYMPETVYVGETFEVVVNVSYPCPSPFSPHEYPASSCNATIILPQGLVLVSGEEEKKALLDTELTPGEFAQVNWTVEAKDPAVYNVTVFAEGIIEGFVGEKPDVGPAYDYQDRIGGYNITLVTVVADETLPTIGEPIQEPSDVVTPDDNVTISVNVTDTESGVKNVTLFYNLNNSTLWTPVPMNFSSPPSFYEATIPKQPAGTWVKYEIIAYDNAGNFVEQNNNENYFVYQVIPEFTSITIILFLVILSIIAVALSRIVSTTKLTD